MWTPHRILLLREACGEIQEEFCKRLNMSIWALRAWEQGQRRPSGAAEMILSQIAAEKGIDVNALAIAPEKETEHV